MRAVFLLVYGYKSPIRARNVSISLSIQVSNQGAHFFYLFVEQLSNQCAHSFFLTNIVNTSLQSGRVSDNWKASRVIRLFKKVKAEDRNNYRPISVLPVLSKILSRAVHRQLYHYLQKHKIVSPFQCGFRKLHSTEFAALSFADTIRRNID